MAKIAIRDIRLDGGTQPREALDMDIVRDYAEAMTAGAIFPAVELVYDGANHWLVDGFHRVAASKQAGLHKVEANVQQGTQQDAQWRSFGVNSTHGLRRSTRDKQRAIKAALKHPNGAGKSDGQIASHIGCDPKTVGRIRTELIATQEIPESTKRVGQDGRVIDTGNIGKKSAPPTREEIQGAVEQVKRNIPAPKIEQKISADVEEWRDEDMPDDVRAIFGADEPEEKTRYKAGMHARCAKCQIEYAQEKVFYDWKRGESRGHVIWEGPCGHRVADHLMLVIEDGDEFSEEIVQAFSYVADSSQEIPATPKIPEKFAVILADPAWKYDQRQFTPYPAMDAGEIAGLDVGALAADDCALFMWVTWPMLREALNVGVAWGFEYSGCAFAWAKQVPSGKEFSPISADENWFFGQGWDGTRANTEVCLLFLKGKPKRLNADVRQLIVSPVEEHSKKPDGQYERIERLFAGPYLELFARQKHDGWYAWGNEIEPDISVSGK